MKKELLEEELLKTVTNLRKKGYEVNVFDNGESAVNYLKDNIQNTVVGFGDSETLSSLNLPQILSQNNKVFWPGDCADIESFLKVAKETLTTEIFLTSVNAMSVTGEFVNIDGTGNRVAGSVFGHKKEYIVLGVNKIEITLEKAIERARNVAAPINAKRLKLKTPCAVKDDRCYDCKSYDRICNAMVLYLSKMQDMEIEVIIIKQQLGY